MATVWDSRFANHALWPLVDQVRTALRGLKLPDDVEQRDSYQRLLWLVEMLKAHKESEDARGYTPTMLDNALRPLEGNVWNNVQQYISDPETYAGNLRAGADNIDSVLDSMGNWPTNQKGAAIAAGQAFSAYDRTVREALDSLNQRRDALVAELEKLNATAVTEKQNIQELRKTFESRADEEILTSIHDLEQKYLAETGESVGKIEESRESASRALGEIRDMQVQGNRIVEAVGNKAVARDYRTNARNKSFAGWIWDAVGLLIGAAALLLLLRHLYDSGVREVDASLALTRVAVSIAGVGLAALCFRRGHDNHSESRRSKRADIRLSTVGGFIAQQDQEFKDALTQAMADRIYLQDIVDSPDSYDPSLMENAIQKLQERLRSAKTEEESVGE